MSTITIQKISITKLNTDAIVNAANPQLSYGGGVCGAVFREAGVAEMSAACEAIGGCRTGNAVITPGFNLPAKFVIHAVGPIWRGGNDNEPKLLYSAYKQALTVAKENGCHSIGFPLISSGIYGYPVDQAWRKALQACNDFIKANGDYDIEIIFAVLDDEVKVLGENVMLELMLGEERPLTLSGMVPVDYRDDGE
jgi:O-acetyl-ADP-ribose deacetylase (regulator of RNase III)